MAGHEYSPADWDRAIHELTENLLAASHTWDRRLEDMARSDAPWTDRGGRDSLTGRTARDSLEAETALSGDGTYIQIVLRSTRESTRPWKGGPNAPVGAFLELGTRRMSRKYEVIRPTLERDVDTYRTAIEQVMNP